MKRECPAEFLLLLEGLDHFGLFQLRFVLGHKECKSSQHEPAIILLSLSKLLVFQKCLYEPLRTTGNILTGLMQQEAFEIN